MEASAAHTQEFQITRIEEQPDYANPGSQSKITTIYFSTPSGTESSVGIPTREATPEHAAQVIATHAHRLEQLHKLTHGPVGSREAMMGYR